MFTRSVMLRLALCAALAATLVSCGGGSGSQSSPPPQSPGPPAPPPLNQAPTVAINAPLTGNSFEAGQDVVFEGSALDIEDGALAGAQLVWTSGTTQLATGNQFTASGLALGTHTIRLTATDSDGAAAATSVSIRITQPAAPAAPRAGETHPYAGRMERTPVKRDDELVLVGRSEAQDQLLLGIVDRPVSQYASQPSSSTPVAPRITARIADAKPVAADSGRILLASHEQAAIVSRTTPASGAAAFRLDVVTLEDPGQETLASTPLAPPFADGAMAVAVADFDAFDELAGRSALTAPADRDSDYHDEVAVAYQDLAGGELRARVLVFSFEDVVRRDEDAEQVPAPTSARSITTTVPMLPASRLVLTQGEAFFGSRPGPHLVAAYLDTSRRVVIDVFKYQHTRADGNDPDPRTDIRSLSHVLHQALTPALSVAAAAAGGWDLVVGRGAQLGVDQLGSFDFAIVAWQSAGQYRQDFWKLESIDGGPTPALLGSTTHAFGTVPDAAGQPVDLTILPDSRVRAVLGRVVDPPPNRCEATGLLVLADTNRGPIVQAMLAFIDNPTDVPVPRFGPVLPSAAWFDPQLRLVETTQTSRSALAAGGFVSARNGLIDDRGAVPGGTTEFARSCNNATSAPLLGQMPSFYVVQPERSLLSAVTLSPGRVAGRGATQVTSIDAAFESVPILLAADANGDAAYYNTLSCTGSATGDCRRIFLGDAELHYVLENVETSNVVLQQPPKHVDYLRELGGIVDVSMRADYFAEFARTDTAGGSVDRRTKTDWSIGARSKVAVGPPIAKDQEFSSVFDLSLDFEHKSVRDQFRSSEVSVSLTQTVGAVDDDVIWGKIQTTDFWRFAAQGGRPEGDANGETGFPDDAFMEIAMPGEPMTSIGPGALNDSYQPLHQPGNILSYPAIGGSVQDIGELFDLLGSYVPTTDPGAAKECKAAGPQDPNGCLIRRVNGALERVAQVTRDDEFIAGEFRTLSDPIDVAEVLQVGGISYQAELEFNDTVKQGETLTNSDTLKGETNVKVPMHGAKLAAEIELQLRASASFENARISENTLGSKTRIALHVPSSIPAERSYRIRPSFGFVPNGGLQVSYQVGTDGAAAPFWQQHYAGPDAALSLPHRIVRSGDGFTLGTDFSRNRLKGFFVRDGAGIDPQRADESVGRVLSAAPLAGDPVQLEARVYNLSVATPLSDLVVRFSAQEYQNGAAVGQPTVLGDSTIEFLPYRGQFADQPQGHVASAWLIWDTTSFGPASGQSLQSWLIHVTLDPDDKIPDETHELQDRFDDPLRGPGGAVIDDGIEKGQNNRGWAMVRVAPSLAATQAASASSKSAGGTLLARDKVKRERMSLSLKRGDTQSGRAPLRGKVRQPLPVSVALHSDRLSRDHGVLQIFDGDPAMGARLLASRRVQGVSGDGLTLEEFTWWPQTGGDRVLYARYLGPGPAVVLQIPTRIAW
jgi:hypothetical protein